ncbi:MAG: class I SAM-dependent methyltransferase [Ornithinimicrobium sp.]|uniref:class I SAM-dependent methyltransferase n=1 Tax=Ornithinimicrobium sp. TaxID=1977084 RepID=UPI003D9BC2C4
MGAAPPGPTETTLGRLAHRGLFTLIAAVPARLRDRLRRGIFEHTFATEDPWGYAQLSYELYKAQELLAAVPPDPSVVIELGCAQGHLSAKLAERLPQAHVVGVDLSPTALCSARSRVREPNCEFLLADAAGLDRAWGARPKAGLLVLSEVLYYLGVRAASPRRWHR